MRTRAGFSILLFVAGTVSLGTAAELDVKQVPLTIPEGFEVLDGRTEEIRGPIPEQPPTTEHSARLKRGEAEVFLFHWVGFPFRDYGPMAPQESWTATVAGQQAKITRTRVFMGQEQEVLVAHFDLPSDHHFMIYTKTLDRPAFEAFLGQLAPRQ
jgi:hypothetical protein